MPINKLPRLYIVLSSISSLVWVCTGILIIASTAYNHNALYKNIFVGVPFILVGCFIHVKKLNTKKLLALKTKNTPKDSARSLQKLLVLETIFTTVCSLLGAILLSAVFTRTLIEKVSTFD